MSEPHFRKANCSSISPLIALLMLPLLPPYSARGQQIAQSTGATANQNPNGEFALRGQRAAREIKYGNWQKFCFKVPGARTVCRTTISGAFETGQSAVRIDVKRGSRVAATVLSASDAAGDQTATWDGQTPTGRIPDGSYTAVLTTTSGLLRAPRC